MKKLFFTFAVVIFSAAGLFAQGVSGGLKVGANFANQNFEVEGFDFKPDSRTSLHLGVFATIMVSETFGVQPELLYNSVGSKVDESVFKMDYLTVPIMIRYNPVPVFNIHVGPQFGFLLSAKQEFDGDSQDIKENMKGLDLGVGVGLGVDLPMGLGFSARYVLGLSNVSDSGDSEDIKVKNNVIQISATYKLFGK